MNSIQKWFSWQTVWWILAIVVGGCANAVPPKGGKPDATPPKVIATEPAQRTLNAHPRTIMLEFNKFIQQRSQVQQSIFLTPPVKVDYSWAGAKTVYINLKEPLDSNTTVALTLGTQYSDWDNVKPEAAYTLIFSTGSKLDSGIIRATVETDKPEGLTAFLYQLPAKTDTLNPATTKPKYKTQIGSKKTLEFPALASGAYRLFVVRDEYRNDVIDKGIDAFGVANEDIVLSEGGTAESSVRMTALEDILPPRMVDVRLITPSVLALRMSEKIHPESVRKELFSIRDSVQLLSESDLPKILAVHPDANNNAILRCYLDRPLQTSYYRQSSAFRSVWRLQAVQLRDSAGNVMPDSLATVYFSDTQEISQAEILPKLVRSQILVKGSLSPFIAPILIDSARGISQQPRIAFTFSEALSRSISEALAQGVVPASLREIIWESAAGQKVEFRSSLEQSHRLTLEPLKPLAPNTWYSLGFRVQNIPLLTGTQMKDSVLLLHFQTDDVRDYGGVSGFITDSVRIQPIKPIVGTNATVSSTTNSSSISNNVTNGTSATLITVSGATTKAIFSTTRASVSTEGAEKNIAPKNSFIVILEAVGAVGNASSPQSNPNSPTSQSSSSTPANVGSNNAASGSSSSAFVQQRFEMRASVDGRWEFANIPPGVYKVSAFSDANNNGRYDGGSFFPFTPAERFIQLPSEIQIRPRWTVENVRIAVP